MPLMPYVTHGENHRERISDIYSALLQDRIIFIGEQITDALANLVVAQLLYLESVAPDKDVTLYINSPGGSVTAGLAIYDTMQHIKCDVSTVCVGMAASMGAFLLSSGAEGKRYALPNSEVMIHQPLGGTQGQVTDMQISLKRLETIKKRLTQILANNTQKDYETVYADCERDNYMDAEAAVAYGIVDRIIA